MGTGEPAYTNSANNTQWVQWSSVGSDAYRIEASYYVNNALVGTHGPFDRSVSGSLWVNWSGVSGVSLPLQEGSTYAICVHGWYSLPTDNLFYPDGPSSCAAGAVSNLRTSTTIDRTPPVIGVTLAGAAAAVKSPQIPLLVGFTDNLAGPFPFNYMCIQKGGSANEACAGQTFSGSEACSVPRAPGKSTSFECIVEVGAATEDGPVHVCVRAADAAVPDNPDSANQTRPANTANISSAVCDSVLLDRVPPTVSFEAPATATVGTPLSLAAQASDGGSGLSGTYEWGWGDGTANGSGVSASHTFTAVGTYEVTLRTADAAGNEATAKRTVVVTPAPTPTPTPSPSPSPSPTSSASPSPSPSPGPTVAPTATATPAPNTAALTVSAPARFPLRAGRRRLPVTLTANVSGEATLALVRAGRIVAQRAAVVRPGSNGLQLKLPKQAKPGKHELTVTFTPLGGAAFTRSVTVKLVGRRTARGAG